MVFHDRAEAGRRRLAHHKGEEVVVFALPRGGVPVAVPIAAMLRAPLDLVRTRKVGTPLQPELAMGAVANGANPVIVRNEDVIVMAGIDEDEFDAACSRELAEIERRRHLYLGARVHPEVLGRVAILVDDGVATGATTRRRCGRSALAIPRPSCLLSPSHPPTPSKLFALRRMRLSVSRSILLLVQSPIFTGTSISLMVTT
jgi:putative phosphoribosyl transferase